MSTTQLVALAVLAGSAFIVAYVYALYPLFLLAVGWLLRRPAPPIPPDDELPSVSILIPAYNEERVLARKLETTLALDYPPDKLEVVVVSDVSTDRTDEIAQSFVPRGIRFIRNEKNKGKIATLSELGPQCRGDILLITDANALFEPDSVKRLAARFADARVGMVNGNKVLERTATMVGDGEGIYWNYETLLKEAESRAFSNAFVTGAMSAIRRELFTPIPAYLEFDHILPMHVVNQDRRVVFEPLARFCEETAVSSRAEFKIRVRNAVRGFTMVRMMGQYLSVLRHPLYALHVWSRKILRWLIGLFAAAIFVANLFLLDQPIFFWLFVLQCAFYGAALAGWAVDRLGVRHWLLAMPFYFCLVNIASLVGLARALAGQRVAVWRTAR